MLESISSATFLATVLYWGYPSILLTVISKIEEDGRKATDGECKAIGWSGIGIMFLWLGSFAFTGEISTEAAYVVSGGAVILFMLMAIGRGKVTSGNPYTLWQYAVRTSVIMTLTFIVAAIGV